MESELDFFRDFVKDNVPHGELITDSHLANASLSKSDTSIPDEQPGTQDWDPDKLTCEDFVEWGFFPE